MKEEANLVEETVEEVITNIPVYDPNKKYSWDKNTRFVLDGAQFGLILNSLRSIVSTDEAIKILLADKACHAIEDIMRDNVASGNIKEV